MNAEQLFRRSFQLIGKGAAEQTITGDMANTAIYYLNNLMYSKDHMGMGYTEVANGTDNITTPAYTWKWMTVALALEMAPEFGVTENAMMLDQMKKQAWSTVLLSLQRISAPTLAGTVPRGSGNYSPGYDSAFYSETDSGILTETNQDIIVEDGTE